MKIVRQILDRMPTATTGSRTRRSPRRREPHRRVDGSADPPLQDLHRGLQGARGRGLRGHREPARRDRLLHRQRRSADPYRIHVRRRASSTSSACRTCCAAVSSPTPSPSSPPSTPSSVRSIADGAINEANVVYAKEIIGRYPKARSATIPLLHLAQQQDGYVTNEAMKHIGELVGATSAEILGTATFYEMFKFEPVGKYLINICSTHVVRVVGRRRTDAPRRAATRDQGRQHHSGRLFTLEHAECQAACTEAPVPAGQLPPSLSGDRRRSRRADRRPQQRPARRRGTAARHGARTRQHIPSDRAVGFRTRRRHHAPVWMPAPAEAQTVNGTTYPHAAGFVAGDRPRRSSHRGSSTTIPTHSRGSWPPTATRDCRPHWRSRRSTCTTTVKSATVLGRGGAGFPAGVKWGLTPPGVWPRYLVVNGDESEPGTYKDRLLMELDPAPAHRGLPDRLLRGRAVAVLPLHPRRDGRGPGARRRRARRGVRGRATSARTSSAATSMSTSSCTGAQAHTWWARRPALIESLEGNRGCRASSRRSSRRPIGLYGKPTIVNNVETLANLPWLMRNGVEAYTAIGTATSPGHAHGRRVGHVKRPGVYEIVNGTTTFRELLYGEEFCGGIHDENQLKAFVPGGGSAPWFRPTNSTCRSRPSSSAQPDRCSAPVRSIVMDDTTDIANAALHVGALLRPQIVRQVVPCHEGGTWLGRIMEANRRRSRNQAAISISCWRSAVDLPRRLPACSQRAWLEAKPFPVR